LCFCCNVIYLLCLLFVNNVQLLLLFSTIHVGCEVFDKIVGGRKWCEACDFVVVLFFYFVCCL
jgi:hypothetical protein